MINSKPPTLPHDSLPALGSHLAKVPQLSKTWLPPWVHMFKTMDLWGLSYPNWDSIILLYPVRKCSGNVSAARGHTGKAVSELLSELLGKCALHPVCLLPTNKGRAHFRDPCVRLSRDEYVFAYLS